MFDDQIDKDLLGVIDALRSADRYIEIIFTEGGCYQFFKFIKTMRPEAEPVINLDKNHIGAKINGVVYDINGIVGWEHKPLSIKMESIAKGWSFSKKAMIQLGECPNCEEPLLR